MCAPPKPPKIKKPVEVKAPEIELGNQESGADTRRLRRRGRNQLRTGLNIPSSGAGLSIPE